MAFRSAASLNVPVGIAKERVLFAPLGRKIRKCSPRSMRAGCIGLVVRGSGEPRESGAGLLLAAHASAEVPADLAQTGSRGAEGDAGSGGDILDLDAPADGVEQGDIAPREAPRNGAERLSRLKSRRRVLAGMSSGSPPERGIHPDVDVRRHVEIERAVTTVSQPRTAFVTLRASSKSARSEAMRRAARARMTCTTSSTNASSTRRRTRERMSGRSARTSAHMARCRAFKAPSARRTRGMCSRPSGRA